MNFSDRVAQGFKRFATQLALSLPSSVIETFLLRAFGFLKIPLLFFVRPSVLDATDDRCVVRIRLKRRSKNHLGSMYFGALAVGADCAGGLIAMRQIRAEGSPISLIFKDFHANFLKRAEGDVHFTCEQGAAIRELVKRANQTGERENMSVRVTATVPSQLGSEPVAQFLLTLSLKRRSFPLRSARK
jgi:acyl-coenzyme A thioesterase PaaI-like protein